MTRDEVIAAHEAVRGSVPISEHQIHVLMHCVNLDELITRVLMDEAHLDQKKRDAIAILGNQTASRFDPVIRSHKESFLCPSDLSRTALPPLKVLLIGQCFFYDWMGVASLKSLNVHTQQYVVGNLQDMPDELFKDAADFDFQVLQVPMRAAIPEHALFRLSEKDSAGFAHLFNVSKDLVKTFIDVMMKFNVVHKTETYVCNFIAPQTGLSGRFGERYALSNILHYISELNAFMFDYIKRFENTYFLDIDNICAVHGKMFSRDDFFAPSMHGGTLTDGDARIDAARIVVPPPASHLYDYNHLPFVYGIWREILAMHRTIRSIDLVKLVVVDLDDTLWRGLIGEGTAGEVEGWPAGFIEALLHLKNRGILLAIISKNDETLVLRNWEMVLGSSIRIDDFAIHKINYSPKPTNMADILTTLNLLPRSVVFIDDNPVERDAMKSAFPDIRVLGDLPLYFKRILMWSSETQVAKLSQESVQRTDMMRAQVAREAERTSMTRDQFLLGLGTIVTIELVAGPDDTKFARAFELLNKTNQFNTTGKRLTRNEALSHFEDGGVFYVFSVRDKHTAYGLVGVLVYLDGVIEQFVMSCRVAGLEIEQGVLTSLISATAPHRTIWRAKLTHTDANLLCRDVYAKSGFALKTGDASDGIWERDPSEPLAHVDHLSIEVAIANRLPAETETVSI